MEDAARSSEAAFCTFFYASIHFLYAFHPQHAKDMAEQTHDRVNIVDLAAFIGRWRVLLFTSVALVALVVSGISFLLPSKYRSTAVIRAAETSSSNIGALLSSKLAMLGGISSSLTPMMGELPGRGLMSLLKSRNLSERVIEEFQLRDVYDMQEAPIEDVLDALKAYTSFEMDIGSSNLIINVDDTSPTRAKEIADFYVAELDRRNRSVKSLQAGKEKEFVGGRLAEARQQLASLEDSMAAFQLRTGLVNVEEQVKATIQATARLEAERLAIRTELDLSRQIYAAGSPEISYLQMQLSSLDQSIRDVLLKSQADGSEDLLLKLEEVPIEGKTYIRLMRDIEIQQLLVAYLLQQFEQAKIEELRNTPTLVVLDYPVAATKRIWPRRGLMVILAAGGAFVLTSLIAMFVDFLQKSHRDPLNPNFAKLQELQRSWKRVRD